MPYLCMYLYYIYYSLLGDYNSKSNLRSLNNSLYYQRVDCRVNLAIDSSYCKYSLVVVTIPSRYWV